MDKKTKKKVLEAKLNLYQTLLDLSVMDTGSDEVKLVYVLAKDKQIQEHLK